MTRRITGSAATTGAVLVAFALLVPGLAQVIAPPKVGPARGAVMLASTQTSQILARFIELAGGPQSPIAFVPTASLQKPGAPQIYVGTSPGDGALRAAGAENVTVLHTFDRSIADSGGFAEPLRRAAGVWFGGGLPENLLDTYAGTRVEVELRDVLARGGVVGGISAGAMVLASDTVNGSLGADRQWVVRKGFSLLRGVAFQPHAQNPKPESWLLERPDLIRLAADNRAAWLVRGDVAEVIGDGRAFVYKATTGVSEVSIVTLVPGDQYELATSDIRRAAR